MHTRFDTFTLLPTALAYPLIRFINLYLENILGIPDISGFLSLSGESFTLQFHDFDADKNTLPLEIICIPWQLLCCRFSLLCDAMQIAKGFAQVCNCHLVALVPPDCATATSQIGCWCHLIAPLVPLPPQLLLTKLVAIATPGCIWLNILPHGLAVIDWANRLGYRRKLRNSVGDFAILHCGRTLVDSYGWCPHFLFHIDLNTVFLPVSTVENCQLGWAVCCQTSQCAV